MSSEYKSKRESIVVERDISDSPEEREEEEGESQESGGSSVNVLHKWKYREKDNLVNKTPYESNRHRTMIQQQVSAYIKYAKEYEDSTILNEVLRSVNSSSWKYVQDNGKNFQVNRFRAHKRRMAKYIHVMMRKATCLQSYGELNYLSCGASGIACTVVMRDDHKTTYVVKFQLADNAFLHELEAMKRFCDLGIGVKLVEHCYVNIQGLTRMVGITIMERVQTTLDSLTEVLNRQQVESIGMQLIACIDKMEKENVGHYDLLPGNIGLNVDDHGNYHVVLIDFGLSLIDTCIREYVVMCLLRGFGYDDDGTIDEEDVQDDVWGQNMISFQRFCYHHQKELRLPLRNNYFHPDTKLIVGRIPQKMYVDWSTSTFKPLRDREIKQISQGTKFT